MLEPKTSEAAFAEPGPEPPFVLEAHSYSGGLRVQVLGHDPNRPLWVPPHDYVGFRNEIALAPGDYVVEFARFHHCRQRVTWVAVYKPAVDEVFGDRLNHAGVGVWLLERDLLHSDTLLHGLKNLTDALVSTGVDTLGGHAESFLGDDYLPAYVAPLHELPPRLAGWTFVAGPLPETSLFAAVDPQAEKAWAFAADQLLRASVLPGPSQAHGRLLILVRPGASGEDLAGPEPIKPNLARDIVRALPMAITETANDALSARERAEEFSARCRDLESELASERTRAAELANLVPALEAESDTLRSQLEGSESYQAWSSLKELIRDVSRQVGRTENAIETARHDILNRLKALQSRTAPASSPELSGGRQVDHREFFSDEKQNDRSSRRAGILMWSAIGVVTLLLLAVAGYVGWTQLSGNPAAEAPVEDILPEIDR